MGEIIAFPAKVNRSLDKLKAGIEERYGVSYLEYMAFTLGDAGPYTKEIARKMDRAMQKESLKIYTRMVEDEKNR